MRSVYYCAGSQALSCGVTIRQQNGTDICIHGGEANSTGRKEVRVIEQVSAGEGTGGGGEKEKLSCALLMSARTPVQYENILTCLLWDL